MQELAGKPPLWWSSSLSIKWYYSNFPGREIGVVPPTCNVNEPQQWLDPQDSHSGTIVVLLPWEQPDSCLIGLKVCITGGNSCLVL